MVRVVFLVKPSEKLEDEVEVEGESLEKIIENILLIFGEEAKPLFYLKSGEYNGATLIVYRGKTYSLDEAKSIKLEKSDKIYVVQASEGG